MPEKMLKAKVYGIVQGVFFRSFTVKEATKLGLKGYVKNNPDGSVEVVAEGNEEKLRELLSALSKGPPAAHVEKIEKEFSDAKGAFSSFSVRY